METLLTEGRWRVSKWVTSYEGYPIYEIQHSCIYAGGEKSAWCTHVFHPTSRGEPCSVCDGAAPEGIQSSFWFLTTENPNYWAGE
jgi:hypothetical protein